MNNNLKSFLISFIVFIFLISGTASLAQLEKTAVDEMNAQTTHYSIFAGFDTKASIGAMIRTIIEAFLGLLALIFIILLILSGYNWMTARGNTEQVEKAKETIRRAVIGLIIIILAYSITYFVFNALPWGGSGSPGGPFGG